MAVPKPLRLFEISVVRFTVDGDGHRWLNRGLLDSLGKFAVSSQSGVLESVTIPVDAFDRNLVSVEAWWAYEHLGPEAVGNFVVDEQAGMILIGLREYYRVGVSPDPRLDLGDVVNVSNRGHVAANAEPLIAGFVIENQHRWVLIRGVGPGMAPYGVPVPVADPYIVLHKNGSAIFEFYNDNWSERHDADLIEQTATRVGAFPLARGSKDAAFLIELAPGAYTLHLGTDGPAGTGLIEVYVVP
jgi:hypothetical protein